LKPIRPRLFSILFIVGDFICLCFIGIGGSLAAIYAPKPIGVDLMIAGLASQVLWTTIFWALVMVMYFRSKNTAIGGNLNYFVFCESVSCLAVDRMLTLNGFRHNIGGALPFYTIMLAGRRAERWVQWPPGLKRRGFYCSG
jgi:hypothetical protein